MSKKKKNPALGMLELCSIAQGIFACDVALKKSTVTLQWASAFQPGKYAFLLKGGEDEVKEALEAAEKASAVFKIDSLLLTQPHPQLIDLINQENETQKSKFFEQAQKEALGLIETYSLTAALRAADSALKESDIQGLELSLSTHLGGKGFFAFCGKLESVEASLQKAVLQAPKAMIMHQQCIARPDANLYWQGMGHS
jgi:microcompartment protein CcmL/EutN